MRPALVLIPLALIPLALLAACGTKPDGGASADDDRALNDAAASLDANDAAPDTGNAQ